MESVDLNWLFVVAVVGSSVVVVGGGVVVVALFKCEYEQKLISLVSDVGNV